MSTKEDMGWYTGKRMVYNYKSNMKKKVTHYHCILGKVTRSHENSGIVRAKCNTNLPPRSMGHKVRVYMYPSNI
ncbi:60S ribosomal protein L35a-3 [Dendrobium catenatum]|uniref:60S ribosomal protein L35a-3 n=2 Tax=Dendrobium catenatum TaxID=906689 RepID=A0A2I0VIU1_9ASPA|nr:60S ribosomal protein L35a-3 [Dendrobium catenatum]